MVQEATIESDRLEWIVERHTRSRFDLVTENWRCLRESGQVHDIAEIVAYFSLIGAASLACVNAPEARLLVLEPLDERSVGAHVDALALMFLAPDGGTRHD